MANGNALTQQTSYAYNVVDAVLTVTQGTQTRLYSYDGLSRVTASTAIPESGTTNFYYTTAAGALCAGDASAVCRRTDARNITTTYVYDALNRLTSVTYSDSTPARSFFYDQTSYNGLTILNGKGRRTGMSDGSGATAWSYDAAGRVLTERRTINASPNVTKDIVYTYNLGSGVTTITYPSGRVITYTYSAIGRPLTTKDVANNINYVTDALYAPPGGLASLKNGVVTGGFAGLTRTNAYNNRLQGSLLSAASPSQTVFSLSYGYGATNNSQIASIVNNLNNNRTQSFTYDTLRRLATAQSQAASGSDCWGQSFGYDRWANKPTDTVTKCTAPALSVTVSSATNRITSAGFAYDNAADLTNENGPTYTWNAEQQLTAAAGVTYTYDGDGLRVKKSNGKMYWRGAGIDTLAETDLSGNNPVEFIYFAGQRVALRDSTGSVFFIYSDHLGSARVITDSTGNVCRDVDYFPYGGEKITLNTCALLTYNFATYERDPESGLDYAIFRYYNSRLGRFMSPDPLAGRVDDSQSLNRYAYVLNDPVNWLDPLGLDLHCTSSQTTGPDGRIIVTVSCHDDADDGPFGFPPDNLNGFGISVVDMLREMTIEFGGPHPWSKPREFVGEAVGKAIDVLAANADYLPGACEGGAFGFLGANAGQKPGGGLAILGDVNYSTKNGLKGSGAGGLGEIFVQSNKGAVGGVGYLTSGEVLIFAGKEQTVPGGGGVGAGAIYGVDTSHGFSPGEILQSIASHGISLGAFAEGHKENGVTGGVGAYITFTTAANCLKP